jgi:hypothetical protein
LVLIGACPCPRFCSHSAPTAKNFSLKIDRKKRRSGGDRRRRRERKTARESERRSEREIVKGESERERLHTVQLTI